MSINFASPGDYDEYQRLFKEKRQLESLVELSQLRNDVEQLKYKIFRKDKPKQIEVHMIEVGQVITEQRSTTAPNGKILAVLMDERIIGVISNNGSLAAELTPERAIELAQLLMKAAECQAEYAAAAKELDKQKAALDAKYKDMISGLGLENPDLKEKDLAAQSWSGVAKPILKIQDKSVW